MNKQQLANKIWESANKMRSKIEASEYKDYILGFMFYKFLSDQELAFLRGEGYEDADIAAALHEENRELVDYCQGKLGYFIPQEHLFSTWLEQGRNFSISNVREAISSFNRNILDAQESIFFKIFNTLNNGLSKLGDSDTIQTKAAHDLIQLIKDIPSDGAKDYDVLGFIYEYLISNFAANAGKKAGEFYTPHEVSQLMSEIVAYYLQDRDTIAIYDSACGSGSLLITIGKSVKKYTKVANNNVHYYAQELKENTYNLTRMNLIMRGIDYKHITVRCGDTLEQDWPMDLTKENKPVRFDAVVSNPPYSQQWDPSNKEIDPRFAKGLSPQNKADFAFLLHDLFHLDNEGVMTIVLPHGVLFRGDPSGSDGEGRIRRNLIEDNHIEAIIGLPANIFFGTSIPTIIMVLRQDREETDVLFIDASKYFTKDGNNNKLRASDIKRIVDAVISRPASIDGFARLVSKEEIRQNDYNLNISRYVNSSENTESYDLYSTMFGGIPNSEIERLNQYWSVFPQLRAELFKQEQGPFSQIAVSNLKHSIESCSEVQSFIADYHTAFANFEDFLTHELIDNPIAVDLTKAEDNIAANIFERLSNLPLLDKYQAYQLLDDHWRSIATDLEVIQTENKRKENSKKVDDKLIPKTVSGETTEIQHSWINYVIPFDLVQTALLKDGVAAIQAKQQRLEGINGELTEIIESIDDCDKGDFLNEDNSAFVSKELTAKIDEFYAKVSSPELSSLKDYLDMSKDKASKSEKLNYINAHPEVNWAQISGNVPYSTSNVNAYVKQLRLAYEFPEDSLEGKLVKASTLLAEAKDIKSGLKKDHCVLQQHTKDTLEALSYEQALELLRLKWITPLSSLLKTMPETVISDLERSVQRLADKYAVSYLDLEQQIHDSKSALASMLDELSGNEFDMRALAQFKALLYGK